MQRVYALASELNVPITIHFQEVNQPGSPGTYNTGLKKFDAMLKAFPKTTFIGHADAFWANVSADYAEDTAYPKGRIVPGGATDRLLGDYPNLYADMSANSGNNFLTRDPEFAAGFLMRHQNKLMFGSDCPCPDGRGGAKGRCVARATLTELKKLACARAVQEDCLGECDADFENLGSYRVIVPSCLSSRFVPSRHRVVRSCSWFCLRGFGRRKCSGLRSETGILAFVVVVASTSAQQSGAPAAPTVTRTPLAHAGPSDARRICGDDGPGGASGRCARRTALAFGDARRLRQRGSNHDGLGGQAGGQLIRLARRSPSSRARFMKG